MSDEEGKPLLPSILEPARAIADQARVVSAFMRAFGVAIGKGMRGAKPLKSQVAAQIQAIPDGTSRLWGKHARMVMEEGIAMLVNELQAEVEVLDKERPLIPEQKSGYVFKIRTGSMAMDGESISNLMNRHAFDGKAAPLSDVRVTMTDARLVLHATFHPNRFVSLPLRMAGTVKASGDGMIELTPVELRAGMLPVDRLMGVLGLELARFMPSDGVRAMSFRGDKVYINPLGMFPAPRATGKLVKVEIQGGYMVMGYDDGTPPEDPPLMAPDADSYLAMVGHDLLVGKITMTDICLQLVPLNPESGWVELSLPHYRAQLAAGESQLNHADQLLYRVPPSSALDAATGRPALKPAP